MPATKDVPSFSFICENLVSDPVEDTVEEIWDEGSLHPNLIRNTETRIKVICKILIVKLALCTGYEEREDAALNRLLVLEILINASLDCLPYPRN